MTLESLTNAEQFEMYLVGRRASERQTKLALISCIKQQVHRPEPLKVFPRDLAFQVYIWRPVRLGAVSSQTVG